MNYNNPIPVVVACLRCFDDRGFVRLLAIERGTAPFIGDLAFPGGYVEQAETAEQAIAREVEEETGLVTGPEHWRPLMTSITPRNQLLVFMRHIMIVDRILEKVTPTVEARGFKLVDAGDALCFPLHHEMLQSRFLWE